MCWSNHQAARGHRSREIGRPDHTDLRVSDAERNDVIAQLSRHTGDGRLSLDEFEQRVEETLKATTRRDLDTVMRGLPRAATPAERRRDLHAGYEALFPVLLVVLAVVLAGPWVLWFAVPMLVCRLKGGRRWHEVEASQPERDELTLV